LKNKEAEAETETEVTIQAELTTQELEEVSGGDLTANTSRDTRMDVSRKYGGGGPAVKVRETCLV